MTPAPRALWRALLGVLAVGVLLGWAPAGAAAPDHRTVPGSAARADDDRVVFTGTFVRRPRIEVDGAAPVRRYQVAVTSVYGSGTITTQRVTVKSRVALETCGQPGVGQGQAQQGQDNQGAGAETTPAQPTTTPAAPVTTAAPIDKQLRVFNATVDGAEYVATCGTVTLADDAVLASLVAQFGEGRAPGITEEPVAEFDEVGYVCPDTGDAVDLDDLDSCAALDDDQPFDRAAAPGLALVIVGVLGLLVARRMGRKA